MSNPFDPTPLSNEPTPKNLVNTPALCLIVISSIAIGLGVLGLVVDGVLLSTGLDQQLDEIQNGSLPKRTQILIRSAWGIVLIAASGFVLYGSIAMRRLQNYRLSRMAAMVAAIPCVGPCCLLGIPFGIWAFVVLGKPEVQQAFENQSSS